LDDLWRQPGGVKPTAFAAAWAAARLDPGRYRVVLLDGLQRTPMDLWLPSLIDVLLTPARPRNLLTFASLGARAIDPARVWHGMDASVIPLLPTAASGLSADLLAGVLGSGGAVTCFDAGSAATPDRAELLAFADEYQGEPEPISLRRVIGALRAAWPLAPSIDPAEIALAFGAPLKEGSVYATSLRSGAEWLRSITNTWD
jgi:hypothetical protein